VVISSRAHSSHTILHGNSKEVTWVKTLIESLAIASRPLQR
jgi:hypothetical protein